MKALLLTQAQCAFCDQAKETLDRLSAEYGFEVATLDIGSAEGQRLAERGGVLFPPGVFLDGEAFSYGRLSERKLRRELDRRRVVQKSGQGVQLGVTPEEEART